MARIFWDTNIFIYYFEDSGSTGKKVRELYKRMQERGDELITSWMSIAEIMVQPTLQGKDDIAAQLKAAILEVSSMVSFDRRASESYLNIRTRTRIKGADAIQLATASAYGVEVFLTNDLQLTGLNIPGIHFVTTVDRMPL